jgi:hypothetical protein
MRYRTLKRVPLDFNAPLYITWKGYINPYPGPRDCPFCNGYGLGLKINPIQAHHLNYVSLLTGRWAHRHYSVDSGLKYKVYLDRKIFGDFSDLFGNCPYCKGKCVTRLPRKLKKRYKNWRPYDPPTGPGYQLWETLTEGSPISPVFETAEKLAGW